MLFLKVADEADFCCQRSKPCRIYIVGKSISGEHVKQRQAAKIKKKSSVKPQNAAVHWPTTSDAYGSSSSACEMV